MAEETVYQNLAEKLRNLPGGAPEGDELDEIMKLLYTPEEAAFLLRISPFLTPLDEIAETVGEPEEEVQATLERLADKGRVFRADKGGVPHYSMIGTMPGLQTTFWGGKTDEKTVKLAKLFKSYYENTDFKKTATAAMDMQITRVIPVEIAVKHEAKVVPYELVSEHIKQNDYFAVAHCPCRMMEKLNGYEGCNHTTLACLKMGNLARFMVSRELGTEVSKEEAFQITRKCQEEGLVPNVLNYDGPSLGFCFCCSCCCVFLRNINEFGNPHVLRYSDYLCTVDEETCAGCGTCEEACPVHALSVQDDVTTVKEDTCIGCGICTIRCPNEALSIKPKEGVTPIPDESDPMVTMIKGAFGEG